MPIKPENKKRYPENWPAIRAEILHRARNRCEKCQVENGKKIVRGMRDFRPCYILECGACFAAGTGEYLGTMRINFEKAKPTKIVLTIAHLDHTPENCAPENLLALCQKCHLDYDRPMHKEAAAKTRAAKRISPSKGKEKDQPFPVKQSVRQSQRVAGQARDHENAEKDDFTPTPPEGIDALLDVEKFDGPIWECACGDGAISRRLEARGYQVISSDLVDRGYGESRVDFLLEYKPRAPNIITNPPFKLFGPFIDKALSLASGKVAMLLPLAYLAGQGRRTGCWEGHGAARIYVFSWRLQMARAGWDKGEGGGSMMNFMWAVWEKGHKGPPTVHWI